MKHVNTNRTVELKTAMLRQRIIFSAGEYHLLAYVKTDQNARFRGLLYIIAWYGYGPARAWLPGDVTCAA